MTTLRMPDARASELKCQQHLAAPCDMKPKSCHHNWEAATLALPALWAPAKTMLLAPEGRLPTYFPQANLQRP